MSQMQCRFKCQGCIKRGVHLRLRFLVCFPGTFSYRLLRLFFFFLLFVSVSVLTGFICPALASAGPGCSPFHLMQAPLTVSKRIDTASPAVKGLVQLNELELI
jgi:hypothetical protein